MRKLVLLAILLGIVGFAAARQVGALGLKVAPLLYEETLAKGEKKKGFVDISNPNDAETTFTSEVSGFKQINDNGDLEFYDEPKYKNGITFDYDQFTLGPRESLRLYFLLDANKLPHGGIYAALFFRTSEPGPNPDSTSIQPSTRVGTLLVIDNGGGGIKQADIQEVKAPFFQFGDSIRATAAVKNTGGEQAIAFFPTLQLRIQPFGGGNDQKAPLVFPGITRSSNLEIPGTYFGFVRLRISSGSNTSTKWVFAATGKGKVIAGGVLLTSAVGVGVLIFRRRKKSVAKNTKL